MEKKTFSVRAEINVELTQQDIDDIMAAALEGGINYWAGEAEVIEDSLPAVPRRNRPHRPVQQTGVSEEPLHRV